MNRTLVATMFTVSLMMVADQAFPAVVDFGIDTTVRHYVVLSSESTVTYHPGIVVLEDPFVFHFIPDPGNAVVDHPSESITVNPSQNGLSRSETRNVSGTFDADFLRYWWKYDLGDPDHSIVLSEQYGVRFFNASLTGGTDWTGLPLLGFSMRSEGKGHASFSWYSGPCQSFPVWPNEHCSGMAYGSTSSASGELFDGKMTLNGVIYIDVYNSYYAYNLVASLVPVPSAIWLFGPLMAGFAFSMRRQPSSSTVSCAIHLMQQVEEERGEGEAFP